MEIGYWENIQRCVLYLPLQDQVFGLHGMPLDGLQTELIPESMGDNKHSIILILNLVVSQQHQMDQLVKIFYLQVRKK